MTLSSRETTACLHWLKKRYNHLRDHKFGSYRKSGTPQYERDRLANIIQGNFSAPEDAVGYLRWALEKWDRWPASSRDNVVGFVASSKRLDEYLSSKKRNKRTNVSGVKENWEV